MPQTLGPFTALSLPVLSLPGILRYYRLADTSGANAVDAKSGVTGTYTGGVTLNQPSLVYDENASVTLDGATGYISAAATSLPTVNAAWSMGAWVTIPSAPAGVQLLMRFGTNSLNTSADLAIAAGGAPYVGFGGGSSLAAPTALSAAARHLVVGVYSGAQFSLYIDGVLATGPTAAAAGNVGTTGLAIGAQVSGAGNFFNGSIDEAFVCSAAISANDVANLFAWGNTGLGGAVIEPGRAFAVAVNRSAQAVQIHNDTPYRLYFQFDGSRPTAITSLNGAYVGMAAPWSHPVIPVQRTAASARERALNAISDFQGVLWVIVIDPTAALAQAGTVSGLAEIHVDVYLPGEMWPQSWAIPRQQDITSQQRVISLPPPGAPLLNARWDPSSFATLGILLLSVSAAIQAFNSTSFYIYHLSLFPEPPAVPTTLVFQMQVQPQNASFANLGSPIVVFRAALTGGLTASQVTATPLILMPHFPLAAALALPAGTVWLAVNLVKTGGNAITCDVNFAVSIDENNVATPPGYGGNVGAAAGRWNGQYNGVAGLW